jgi:hypothetical protein
MKWLDTESDTRDLLHAGGEGFDPFRYNETAAVGFLVAAAGIYLRQPEAS